jgi:hypothetical protein
MAARIAMIAMTNSKTAVQIRFFTGRGDKETAILLGKIKQAAAPKIFEPGTPPLKQPL